MSWGKSFSNIYLQMYVPTEDIMEWMNVRVYVCPVSVQSRIHTKRQLWWFRIGLEPQTICARTQLNFDTWCEWCNWKQWIPFKY